MKEVFMNASIITAIVLAFVGIAKLPFKTFKDKHPKWYRFTFCFLSIVLSLGLPVLAQLYVIHGPFASLEFVVLEVATIAGVFGLYTSYEGLGLKQLVKTIVDKIAELSNKYSDSKLAKVVDKVGIEKLNEISKKLEQQKAEAEVAKQQQKKQ